MKKIKFPNEIFEQLHTCWLNDEKIVILGCNDLGQSFKVEGKIATNNKKGCGVLEDCVYMEFFARDKYSDGRTSTNDRGGLACDYMLNLDQTILMSNLYLLAIENTDEQIIYANPSAGEILKACKANGAAVKDRLRKTKRYITKNNADELLLKMQAYIGQPIAVNDEHTGVLISLYQYDLKAQPMIELNRGGGLAGLHLESGDKLYLLKENGVKQLIGIYDEDNSNKELVLSKIKLANEKIDNTKGLY